MLQQVDEILRELADDPSEYEREGGFALLFRHGRSYSLTLKDVPGTGVSVEAETPNGRVHLTPLSQFIQHHLLELPRLALQVRKVLDRSSADRPTKYIDGPAELINNNQRQRWSNTAQGFLHFLSEQEPGRFREHQV